jgi:chromosome condensin MukBEF ATPase and DNA-binding subunit MukB
MKRINKIDNKIKHITEKSLEKLCCLFCEKSFSTRGNLLNHIKEICLVKKTLDNEKDLILKIQSDKINELKSIYNENSNNVIDIMNEQMESIKREIDILKNNKSTKTNTINNTTNNITINNPIITNNLNITINSFGQEKLDHITEADYKKYLNSFFKGLSNLIEKIHFDENVPENHNISFTNLRSKYINIYDNNKWITIDKNEIVDKIISKKYDLLNDKFEELKENNKLNNKITNNFEEFQENYNNLEAKKNTKENIKLLLYNNRNKIKKI